MAIFDLFSKRQKALRGDILDVYTYIDLPNALRVQIIHIWSDALGSNKKYFDQYGSGSNVQFAYKFIVETLCREYGFFHLPTAKEYQEECTQMSWPTIYCKLMILKYN